MNLNFKSYLKHLPMATGAIRYARAVAFRFALHETGVLLCACAPLIFRAGESLQHFSDPPAAKTAQSPLPVRVDATTPPPKVPAPVPISPITPAASIDATPDQPETINPNNQPERNTEPMQNGTSSNNNGSGHHPSATDSSTPAVVKSTVEQALDQIEAMKGTIRGVVANLNGLADTLRQVQRDRRSSEREVRSVRDMVKTLQTVRL